MVDLSPDFINRVIGVHGQKGKDWLKNLAAIQDQLAGKWSLSDFQPAAELSYNYLAYANNALGDPVVLKIGVPNPELRSEIKALRVYNGVAAVKLIDADPELGALLLERLLPGEDLRSIEDDDKATRIAALLMKRIWTPLPLNADFTTAADWCAGFDRYKTTYPASGPLPERLVDRAAGLASDLLSRTKQQVLLHGDLHHMNILRGASDWLAIDPKGIIGEPAFEIGALLFNPWPDLIKRPDLRNILDRRIRILVETLELDEKRVRDWSFARGILSAIWNVEDGEDWAYAVEVSKTILKV